MGGLGSGVRVSVGDGGGEEEDESVVRGLWGRGLRVWRQSGRYVKEMGGLKRWEMKGIALWIRDMVVFLKEEIMEFL